VSAFYVGQRVRFVGLPAETSTVKTGACGIFKGAHPLAEIFTKPNTVLVVMDEGQDFGCLPDELVPVVPPHEPAELTVEELLPFLELAPA
jgi:hypothetical protein